jgi:uncharacterized membrane protein YidH (DUF202 family)
MSEAPTRRSRDGGSRDGGSRDGDATVETPKERIDRELLELLNELRVALPGVQFLFAFLLILPFQTTADELTDFHRQVFFVALVSAAVATGLLIAPAAHHRVLFRQKDKERLLKRSNQSALLGLAALVVAICAALLLVVDIFFSSTQAWLTTGLIAAFLTTWWIVVPFWRRRHTALDDPHGLEEE